MIESLGTPPWPYETDGRGRVDRRKFLDLVTDNFPHSDGIARVHGMANVQAEELVEYVNP